MKICIAIILVCLTAGCNTFSGPTIYVDRLTTEEAIRGCKAAGIETHAVACTIQFGNTYVIITNQYPECEAHERDHIRYGAFHKGRDANCSERAK